MRYLLICLLIGGCCSNTAVCGQLKLRVPDTLLIVPPTLKTLEEDPEKIPMQPTKSIIAFKCGESN